MGNQVKLELVAPLFAGKISPITDDDRRVDPEVETGTWSWQLQPDRPGKYELSLLLSVLSPDGKEIELQNPRVKIGLDSQGTGEYYLSQTGRFIEALVTSVNGLILGATGAAAALIALSPKLRRKKQAQSGGGGDTPSPGYM